MIKNSVLTILAILAIVFGGMMVTSFFLVLLTVFVLYWALGQPISMTLGDRKGHLKWFTFYPNSN